MKWRIGGVHVGTVVWRAVVAAILGWLGLGEVRDAPQAAAVQATAAGVAAPK